MKGADDLRVVTCNVRSATSVNAAGAKAYLILPGRDRSELLVRSRSGRWVRRWEAMANLTNWRYTTVVPQSSEHAHFKGLFLDWPIPPPS